MLIGLLLLLLLRFLCTLSVLPFYKPLAVGKRLNKGTELKWITDCGNNEYNFRE
jgi:hypothetical protein